MIYGLLQTTILSILLFSFIRCVKYGFVIISKWDFSLIFLNNVTWHLGYHFHLQENSEFLVGIIILYSISGYLIENVCSEIKLQEKKLEEANYRIRELNWKLSNWRLVYSKNNDNHLREIIDIVDDIKEKIPNGDYLKLMDNTKKIYENKDDLYRGWWSDSFYH